MDLKSQKKKHKIWLEEVKFFYCENHKYVVILYYLKCKYKLLFAKYVHTF